MRYRQDIREADIGDRIPAGPSLYGGHNWQASAYHPGAGALVIPLHQVCMHLTGREVEMVEGGGGEAGRMMAPSAICAAIDDALGIRIRRLPATPERIVEMVDAAAGE